MLFHSLAVNRENVCLEFYLCQKCSIFKFFQIVNLDGKTASDIADENENEEILHYIMGRDYYQMCTVSTSVLCVYCMSRCTVCGYCKYM